MFWMYAKGTSLLNYLLELELRNLKGFCCRDLNLSLIKEVLGLEDLSDESGVLDLERASLCLVESNNRWRVEGESIATGVEGVTAFVGEVSVFWGVTGAGVCVVKGV